MHPRVPRENLSYGQTCVGTTGEQVIVPKGIARSYRQQSTHICGRRHCGAVNPDGPNLSDSGAVSGSDMASPRGFERYITALTLPAKGWLRAA